MSKLKIITIGLALGYLFIAGCSKKQADEIVPLVVPPGSTPVAVTYAAVIGPLFQSRCASCHAPGKSSSGIWNFNGYATVTANADRIKTQVLVLKKMPLGGSLSAAELKSVQDWFDQGMPQ